MGVETYDVDKKQNFLMRVALLWTISDFPAYAMLSGWSTAGRLACPYCMDNTDAFTLPRGGKQCWFDNHCKFLNHNHPWRKNKSWFRKNKVVTEHAPLVRTGEEILHEIESLGLMRVTDPGSNVVNAVISKTCGWRKRSIFWDLPYWSSLLIRHNLDVMHIEKNFFDNLFNTIMNIEGKTKDNAKAREDMREICRRPELEVNAETGRYPKAIYALDKLAKQVICEWMKGLRFPDGYVSNMARCVDMNKYRLFGMKSHDCHIFMQKLLPIAFRELLSMRMWEAITELSIFFKQLTSTILREEDMQRLEEDIPVILCKLERIFPPGFFDSMEHLPVHLAYEARIGGPVQYRWMYPYERYNGILKKNIKNKAKVEGSIANAYLVEEASSFCAYYFESHVSTRHRRVPRNDDGGVVEDQEIEGNLSIFKYPGRPIGQSKKRILTKDERNAAHLYILLNCEEVSPFIK
ncbi:uncharacterized protein LOC110608873 [Manihot esculenta]|uniref:uncharacterized protein LOC110608873 n=1 Tax=Manihot esculenta TaxID=3983 RepID=UPI000B5D2084|nr:uncharacterized protein LOC110608873 [Manihot esculenta]